MKLKVLHVSLEYTYGVGGLKTVLTGLLPVLQNNNLAITIVTPYYDFIQNSNLECQPLHEVSHMYKQKLHSSIIFKVINNSTSSNNLEHYLISPKSNSNVAQIFNIHNQENIYKAFMHSEPQYRLEYFNSAISALVRIRSSKIPIFDIVQTHAWHTSLSICLIKEFDQLTWIKNHTTLKLNPIPKIINTIHMLSNEQGLLTSKTEIVATLRSVGLPLDPKFLFNYQQLNQMYLGLQYADQNLIVSAGLVKSITNGKNYGLGNIFNTLEQLEKINAINNGICTENFDASLIKNLGKFSIKENSTDIFENKLQIKKYLLNKYITLNQDPKAIWYIYIGRFALEKGIDMLPHALEVIQEQADNLIIMGCYINEEQQNQKIINNLKNQKNTILIDNYQEQLLFGKYFRAASDFTLIPSHYEACGLISMEAMMSYSIPISSDVQGLPDTVISLIEDPEQGNGFIYNNDPVNKISNFKNIITTARNKYLTWKQENNLNEKLYRIHEQAKHFDWQRTPIKKYLKLYEKTKETITINTPYIMDPFPLIKILHIALEYQQATWGGLGTVTTELINAQNKFNNGNSFQANIITPYYAIFPKNLPLIYKIHHFYNNNIVESHVYLIEYENTKHYLIKPSNNDLFELNNPQQLYYSKDLINRIKYFNSAAANFIVNYKPLQLNIIQIHDWTTALTAVLLKELYQFQNSKIVYTVHINNEDRGVYSKQDLEGINLYFTKPFYTLKQLGIEYSDYTIGVSNNVLTECSKIADPKEPNPALTGLITSFLHKKYTKNSVGILNGINYTKKCYLNKIMLEEKNLSLRKLKLKQQLALSLTEKLSNWKIDPNLPLILYIGRFSKEKGIDCFKKVIETIQDQAIFIAIGKGGDEEIIDLIMTISRQRHNVFISFSESEQQKYGTILRAAADFMFIPSHNEACGLIAMEGLANGCICITSGVGGLKDFITPFNYDHDNFSGNGFLFQDHNELSLEITIKNALDLWQQISTTTKHDIHYELMEQAKKFDWLAEQGPVHKYFETFKQILTFQPNSNPSLLLKYRI